MKRILVIEDDIKINELIVEFLKSEGYEVDNAFNGISGYSKFKEKNYDLVILDVMMPKLNGIETCIKIREENELPIIMLSAKSEDIDKILGLNMGADDYLSKPFNTLELIARVKSQLRRYKKFNNYQDKNNDNEDKLTITIDDLVIKIDTHEVFLSDNSIRFTPIEFDILVLLAKNRGKIFSIVNIYESVWNQEYMESDNTVMVHIRKIREKIEEDPRNPRFIKTVWGVGYKIEK